jgi:MAF protein
MSKQFILASSSPFRATLLKTILPSFDCISPNINESRQDKEAPEEMVQRLAVKKAKAIQQQINTDNALIIASDQCALFNDEILGKPHSIQNAEAQLAKFSGHKITFLTSLCLLDTQSNKHQVIVEPFYVHFRTLSYVEIKNYVGKEMPLNCAGSFKSEGLGIALFEKLEGNDPNSLIGLPLIQLNKMLQSIGINVLL